MLIELTEDQIDVLRQLARDKTHLLMPEFAQALLAALSTPAPIGETQLAAAQPVQISPLERLEAWRMRHRNRRWEISRTTNIATVTLFFGGIAYTCMRPTLEAAIIGALAKVQGVDHE